MFTKCPACGSFNVRRSSIRAREASGTPRVRSPYRCRECGERFTVISRRVYYLVGVFGIAVAAGVIVWHVVGARDETRRDPKPTAVVLEGLAEAIKLAESNDP